MSFGTYKTACKPNPRVLRFIIYDFDFQRNQGKNLNGCDYLLSFNNEFVLLL